MGRTQTVTALFGGFVFVLVAADRADAGDCGASDPECHLANGQKLLASDPHRAADELYASYQLDERTETLTLYAQALAADGKHARALETWQRIILFRESEIEAAREAMAAASVKKRKAARAQLAQAQEASEQAAAAIMTLWPKVAKVKLAGNGEPFAVFAGSTELDPTKEILVNAGHDELRIAWGAGKSTTLVVEVPAGQVRTVDVPRAQAAPVVAMTTKPEPMKPEPMKPATPAPMPKAPVDAAPAPVIVTETRSPMTMRTVVVQRSRAMSRVGLGIAAGGVVALGVAGSFAYLANRDFDDAKGLGCDASGECPVGPASELGERAHDRTRYAQITAVGGAALVATGVTMWILGRGKTTKSVTDVTLSVAPSYSGAGVAWSFQ